MELNWILGALFVLALLYLILGAFSTDDRFRPFVLILAIWFLVVAVGFVLVDEIRELGDRINSLGEVSGE